MRMNKLLFVGLVSLLTIRCGGQRAEESEFSEDTTATNSQLDINRVDRKPYYDSTRESLKFEITDTLKFSKSFHFSNRDIEDHFLLTINPGLINKSKSEFKILSDQGELIYTQIFDSYSFIIGIFQPPSVPPSGQEVYDRYRTEYIKSLTQNQYDSYVKKNIENFYDQIHFLKRDRLNDLSKWDETNKEALKEVLSDTTIILVDISCFDCYEGGEIVFYSKDSKDIKTLLSHD